MNYTEALAYLDGFVNFERTAPGMTRHGRTTITIERVRELAERLGNPQNRFPSIHVAGTKGKGSTCAFAAGILASAGLKVGLYVSPHLQDVRERISINGRMIPESDFARLLDACRPTLEAMRVPPKGERRPTYFEVLTHLAFSWFAEQNVDVGVIEVGLGGRLDATNIIHPVVCGITNISYDHMAILGDSLELIAREKAGILKKDIPAVLSPQVPEAEAALLAVATSRGTPVEIIGRELQLVTVPSPETNGCYLPLQRARLLLPDGRTYAAEPGLRGAYQAENWAVAVRLADLFYSSIKHSAIPLTAVQDGSRGVLWPGRLEEIKLKHSPCIFLDGAHNDHSLRAVLAELSANRQPQRRAILFACAKDKDSRGMLAAVRDSGEWQMIFTHSGNVRGKDPGELAAEWHEISGQTAGVCAQCAEGFSAAHEAAGRDGLLLVTGSLYLVGAIKDLLQPELVASR